MSNEVAASLATPYPTGKHKVRGCAGMAQFRLAHARARRHNRAMFKNLLLAGLAALVVPAFAAEWMTDLAAAQTKAAAENKAVLVDFTGSDWCGYCIRLKKAVFDTPEFEAYAADKFVLVEVDVPRDVNRVGGAENYARNEALCREFQISGFPTIMVLNATGDVLGGFVGGQPNMQAAMAPLNAALENGKKIEAAAALQGVEKAKALMEVYSSLPADLQNSADKLAKQIAELDTENATGIQSKMQEGETMKELESKLQQCGRNPEAALAVVNETLPKVSGANREMLLQLRGAILNALVNKALSKAKTEAEVMAVKPLAEQLLDCVPADQRAAVAAEIEKVFANPAAILKGKPADKVKAAPAAPQK